MNKYKYYAYKILVFVLLRLPDVFFALLLKFAFPVYRILHTKRAYGRVDRLLRETGFWGRGAKRRPRVSPRDVFESLYWNGIDSYRLLAGIPSATRRVRIENEYIIMDAAKAEPVAAISIHQGAFENMHRILCNYSQHVHLVTNAFQNKELTQVVRDLRYHPHLSEYNIEDVAQVLRNLFKTRGILAMVVDQSRAPKGNKISLFDKESLLYLRLPIKANQMGASIVTFRTYCENIRQNGKWVRQHVVRFENYYPPKMAATPQGEEMLVKAIGNDVERWIGEHPEQWTWNYHRNFKV